MDIRVLRYFLAVAREESISGAAEFLHITQPTLSRQLMDLEEELGKKLLIRGSRRITLTSDGMLLRKRAEELVSLFEKTAAELHAPEESVSGDVYIGAGETDVMRAVAKAIKSLQNDYPEIRYHLFSGNAEDVTERLDKGLLDFGVLIEPADIQKYDSIRLPGVDVWGVLMRKDSPLASREKICPEDLWNLPLILSRQFMVSREISRWLKKDTDALNIAVTYNLVFNASLMVEEGFGYALCLHKLINITDDSNLCFKPLEPRLTARLDIVWKKYQIFSKPAEVFLKKMQEAFPATADDAADDGYASKF